MTGGNQVNLSLPLLALTVNKRNYIQVFNGPNVVFFF